MSDRARALAITAGCLAVLVAVYVLAIAPRLSETRDLERRTGQTGEEARETQAAIERLVALAERLPRDRAQVRRLTAAVPADPEPADLLHRLDGAARDGAVRLLDTAVERPGAPVAGLPPGAGQTAFGPVLPLSLAFSGAYADLGDVARRLADWVRDDGGRLRVSGRLLTLEALELEAAPGRAVDATLTAMAYLARPEAGR